MSIKYDKSSSIVYGSNNTVRKTVATPRDEYRSILGEWKRNRAVVQGQQHTKDFDQYPDVNNILLPFNSTMTSEQYNHYKAEAELPGVSAQYAKMLTGGLLRKLPTLEIYDNRINVEEIKDWIENRFGQGNESLISFLDNCLWEEMQTSRAWVQVDYPNLDLESLTPEERREVTPFPRLWNAESVINWSTSINPINGNTILDTIVLRSYAPADNSLHPDYIDTVWVHRINEQGLYVIDTYVSNKTDALAPKFIDGQIDQEYGDNTDTWTLVSTNENIFVQGERLTVLPFFPLNGSIDIVDPVFTPIVDREVALYNKISRRNHLLYLAATYTPVVKSDTLTDSDKDQLARQGLGTWMFIGKDDEINTLSTPTESLKDMEAAITNGYDELTRIGVKMLSLEPNNSDQSGVALQIRNASQSAQIATLNAKISETIKKVIQFMIHWRTGIIVEDRNLRFTLSSDFNKLSTSSETIRLISEWYSSGLIPRTLFVEIMKNNDILPSDYDDDRAVGEIEADALVMSPRQQQEAEVESITADENNNMEERISALEENTNNETSEDN